MKLCPTPTGRLKQARRPWTAAEDEQVKALYPDLPASEVAQQLGRTKASVFQRARLLGLGKSAAFFESDKSGRTLRGKTNPAMTATRFQKGFVPWNKGLKGSCGTHPNCRKAQFQKGSKNGRALAIEQPIGAERVAEGVLQIKVNNDLPFRRRYQALHGLVWEATNGAIPPGHKVIFRPGLHTTVAALITLDRLELVTNAELMCRNSFHNRYPKDVAQLIQIKGQLTRKINRKTEELNEK